MYRATKHNTDHWAKVRVQANRARARKLMQNLNQPVLETLVTLDVAGLPLRKSEPAESGSWPDTAECPVDRIRQLHKQVMDESSCLEESSSQTRLHHFGGAKLPGMKRQLVLNKKDLEIYDRFWFSDKWSIGYIKPRYPKARLHNRRPKDIRFHNTSKKATEQRN